LINCTSITSIEVRPEPCDIGGLGRREAVTAVPLVSIVDDDDNVRMATGGLVETLGYDVEILSPAKRF
jgi:hypothetical protein